MFRTIHGSVSGRALEWIVLALSTVCAGVPTATGQDYDWGPLGSGMNGETSPYVSALTTYNGELIAGVSFTTAGGCRDPVRNVALSPAERHHVRPWGRLAEEVLYAPHITARRIGCRIS